MLSFARAPAPRFPWAVRNIPAPPRKMKSMPAGFVGNSASKYTSSDRTTGVKKPC